MHPRYGVNPQNAACGTQYQEAATPGLGLCHVCESLGAVGLCVDCRQPVDGVHGTVMTEGVVCSECVTARRRAAEAQEKQAAVEQEEKVRAWATSAPDISIEKAVRILFFTPYGQYRDLASPIIWSANRALKNVAGDEFARAFLAQRPDYLRPAIATTYKGRESSRIGRRRAIAAGVEAFWIKPHGNHSSYGPHCTGITREREWVQFASYGDERGDVATSISRNVVASPELLQSIIAGATAALLRCVHDRPPD